MQATPASVATNGLNRPKTIRESQRRNDELMQSLGVAVYTTDAEGRLTFFNEAAAELWGRRPTLGEDLWCGSYRILWPDGTPLPHDECPMAMALKENRPVRGVEAIAERPDGTRFNFIPFPTPLRDTRGNVIGAVNVLVDVTEQRQAEQAAAQAIQESMKIKDQFLSLVSHELRTPIATIVGNAILLEGRGARLNDEDRQQALVDIKEESQKLHTIIENLLLITRMEADRQPDPEPLSVGSIVRAAVASFEKRVPARAVTIHEAPAVPIGMGNTDLIYLVVDNLLTNADKYSANDTTIEVTVQTDDCGAVEVRIRDYGIGLEEEELAEVFTPFYRSKRAAAHAPGVGLGLAVCKRVVEAQGGEIQAIARPDGGCDFVFTLPAAAASE